MDTASRTCPWCSASIPAGATVCPSCGDSVVSNTTADIPGVTVVDSTAGFHDDEGLVPDAIDPLSWLNAGRGDQSGHEAVHPPSEDVQREIRRMELEAEIDNAGRSVMNPTGDEAINVGMPSQEAIEAYEAGLLDDAGTVDAADLEERAQGLEIDKQA
jgi:RNA polymerase subunit RPABC4/transcription elongation factor Spt4